MSEILFSIITVTLNPGVLLEKTVLSVARQNFTNYEHLIKDGGSTDGSLDCVTLNSRSRLIRKPDQGIYDAMNQALVESVGRYVIFVNAGDVFCDELVLGKIAARLQANDTDFLYGHIEQDGVWVRYPKVLSNWYLVRNSICHQALVVRRSCCEALGGFNLDYQVLADHFMLLTLVIKQRATYQLFAEPIISVAPMGFSALNRQRKGYERKQMMAVFFGDFRGRLLRILHALTLPGLRTCLSRHRLSRQGYSMISNFFNR